MRRSALLAVLLLGAVTAAAVAGDKGSPADALKNVRRVVFLGDSITYSGGYVEDLEAYLRLTEPTLHCEFLNLGLPSETVSGLSEPGHAGGSFPRPDLHERLDRVLKLTKPDLAVAMYGMNDGIYYPFGAERFEKFQKGMTRLHDKATAAGARVLHLTPPVFDPVPILANTLPAGLTEYPKPYVGYDEALERYSAWLLARKADGWDVVDIHGPTARALAAGRRRDPKYHLAGDGVHLDATGHWLIAREILAHWGYAGRDVEKAETYLGAFSPLRHGLQALGLVQQRQRLLKDAWLSATEHKRPGMQTGLPLAEAERQAAEINDRINALLATKR